MRRLHVDRTWEKTCLHLFLDPHDLRARQCEAMILSGTMTASTTPMERTPRCQTAALFGVLYSGSTSVRRGGATGELNWFSSLVLVLEQNRAAERRAAGKLFKNSLYL